MNDTSNFPFEQTVKQAARTAYEANRVYCRAINDPVPLPWYDLTNAQQEGYLNAVRSLLANPQRTSAEQHEEWMKARIQDGWKYGKVKDEFYKRHPNLLPYEALPESQQCKDALFRTIVLNVAQG